MISVKVADKIILELKGVQGYPDNAWMRTKLGKALTVAATEDHARAAIERCMEASHWCPDVPTIIAALDSTPRASHLGGCERCGGEGWYHVPQQHGHGTMVCCVCDLGRAKARVARGDTT